MKMNNSLRVPTLEVIDIKAPKPLVPTPDNMEEVFRFCDSARTPTDAIIAVYMTVNYLTKLFEDE